jgi:ribosomal 50S subunit-associated protein YjgA (DUF615 family)
VTPLWLYGGAGALLAGALAGWTVRDWKADSDALKAEEKAQTEYVAAVQMLADQSLAYEALAQTIRASERTDRETIREIYRNVQVPANCAAPAAAVSLLDNAVRDANAAAAGKPRGEVPPAP